MTKEELQKLKQILIKERDEITAELQKIGHENPLIKGDYEATMTPSDPSDSLDIKAQHVTEYETDKAVEQELELRLLHINHTLNQIEAGSYGNCTNCGAEIHEKRLKAIPTAVTCIDCSAREGSA